MGFFSWATADKGETIPGQHTGHPFTNRPVYLIMPDGQPPIEETNYGADGIMGGKDVFEILADMNNIEKAGIKDDEDKRSIGIIIDNDAKVYEDVNGKKWAYKGLFSKTIRDKFNLTPFPGDYATPIPELGNMSPNDLKEKGLFKPVSMIDMIKEKTGISEIKYLKFSYNKNAVYEELERSLNDPTQGHFYGEEATEEVFYIEGEDNKVKDDLIDKLIEADAEIAELPEDYADYLVLGDNPDQEIVEEKKKNSPHTKIITMEEAYGMCTGWPTIVAEVKSKKEGIKSNMENEDELDQNAGIKIK